MFWLDGVKMFLALPSVGGRRIWATDLPPPAHSSLRQQADPPINPGVTPACVTTADPLERRRQGQRALSPLGSKHDPNSGEESR